MKANHHRNKLVLSTSRKTSQTNPLDQPPESNTAIETGKDKIPSWVDETFPELAYGLVVWEGGGGQVEGMDLTRAEYITLKTHLAAMRGYFDSAELYDRLAKLAK